MRKFNSGDTLADAISASLHYHKKDYAIVLADKFKKREEMRKQQADLDEEQPLSDSEFNAWVEKYFKN